jgi:tetratricopeptide (TPR) repeat protein
MVSKRKKYPMVETFATFRLVLLVLFFPSIVSAQWMQNHPNAIIREGNKAYKEGSFDVAGQNYRRTLSLDSLNPIALYNLGNSFYRSGNQDTALYFYEKAAGRLSDPIQRSQANYNLGTTYMQKKEWNKGINALIESLKDNPNQTHARYNLAYALKMLQQQEQQQQQQQQQNQQQDEKKQESSQPQDDKAQNNQSNTQERMNREQAEQLIDAMNRKEESLQKDKNDQIGRGRKSKRKDW